MAVLEKMVADAHANVRFRVALALGLIGQESGLSTLEKMINDHHKIGEHAVVRAVTAMARGKIGHPNAMPLLARLVNDPDPVVR